MTKTKEISLTPVMKRFILHWGDMGTRWGINRTVAQIHALLYLASRPLSAEEIANALSVARSNVSTSLRELQGWGIVRATHVLGDRRDYFESLSEVWEMFQLILAERKRREMDPTLAMLRQQVAEAGRSGTQVDGHVRERLQAMLDFFETMSAAYEEMRSISVRDLRLLLRLRGRARKLVQAALKH